MNHRWPGLISVVENHHKQKWLKVTMRSSLKLVKCKSNDSKKSYFNDEYRLQCNQNKNHLIFNANHSFNCPPNYQSSILLNDNIKNEKQINTLTTSRRSVNTEDFIPPGHW